MNFRVRLLTVAGFLLAAASAVFLIMGVNQKTLAQQYFHVILDDQPELERRVKAAEANWSHSLGLGAILGASALYCFLRGEKSAYNDRSNLGR